MSIWPKRTCELAKENLKTFPNLKCDFTAHKTHTWELLGPHTYTHMPSQIERIIRPQTPSWVCSSPGDSARLTISLPCCHPLLSSTNCLLTNKSCKKSYWTRNYSLVLKLWDAQLHFPDLHTYIVTCTACGNVNAPTVNPLVGKRLSLKCSMKTNTVC